MATIQELITVKLARLNQTLSQIEYNYVLAKVGLDSTSPDTSEKAELAIAYAITEVLPFIPSKVTEGGYSMEWSKEAATEYRNSIYTRYGIAIPGNSQPTVSEASNRW
ncbi:hypothetical protein GO755_34915 [Spirosoma sp. HMF4905]|uniref:Uncharacterized protein n=1 Tax=Spirosoma arboris TaxID=2682092 RepID=A0A7K1SNV7_9BACT|nr:DUF6706 family protein [Spirosoma arboris]MVM35266.1 hypothetical protein [Spirosoma arboris]